MITAPVRKLVVACGSMSAVAWWFRELSSGHDDFGESQFGPGLISPAGTRLTSALRRGVYAVIETGPVLLSPCRRRRDYGVATRVATGCEANPRISADQETSSDVKFMKRKDRAACAECMAEGPTTSVVLVRPMLNLPIRPLFWLVWRRPGLGLQRLHRPSSPAALPHSSRGNKLGYRRPPLTLRPVGCSRPNRRLMTAIEAA